MILDSDFGFPISLGDRRGTFSRETDTTQATTATKQYDAFGLLTSSSGTSLSPFGFAGGWGYQEDTDSALKLLGHRYYDPSTGRFLTRDPLKDSRNWYAYCLGNPSGWADPLGLQPGPIPPSQIGTLPTVNPNLTGSDIEAIVGSRLHHHHHGGGSGGGSGGGLGNIGKATVTAATYAAPGGVSEGGAGGEALCTGGATAVKARLRWQDILNDPEMNADYDHPAAAARAAAAYDGSDYHPLGQ